ncbi:MAG: S-layer protein [Lacrimispora celerecrescens]|nr:S-layer protein [Lacrimispora celerecrescens]
MKKFFAALLACGLAFGLTACSGGTPKNEPAAESQAATQKGEGNEVSEAAGKTPQDFKKFKIGVAEVQANDESIQRRSYFEDYVAPRYNVEFVFSEQVSDTEKLLTFIENCADAGCDAVISYNNDDIEQMTQVCQEYGMKYIVNTVRINPKTEAAFAGGYDNFAAFGSNQTAIAEVFSDWLKENASEDGSEGFLICSGLAYTGNLQQTEITQACLKSLSELYGLTYEEDFDALVTSSAPIEAVNDKGINIYVYPGHVTRVEGYLQGLTAALQTGKYGVMLQSVQLYDQTGVIVQETEAAIGKDIKVAGVATIAESLHTAFKTKDQFGNPTINMATVKPVSLLCAAGFSQAYNLLTGYESATLAPNGDAGMLNSSLWPITKLEDLDIASKWDVPKGDKWIVGYNIIDSMLGIYHPDITNGDIQSIVDSITYESTLIRLGDK